jgi:ribosome biogenesis GTPase / thiamine phosphate phosphatase
LYHLSKTPENLFCYSFTMNLHHLGFTHEFEKALKESGPDIFEPGRVIAEHKERYIVYTAKGEVDAEITGNLRYTAQGREDFPAVGDWVALSVYDSGQALIHQVLPRSSLIKRKSAGNTGEVQLIAANIDYALIMQSVDRDFNLNRIERYLAICHASGVMPAIVLTKSDLVQEEELTQLKKAIAERMANIPVFAISNHTHFGYEQIRQFLEPGKTYCMLGSSGVGKSSLMNNLSGMNHMKTGSISESTSKGRHVTSHRELIVLESGAMLIDNPGMREVGLADVPGGLEMTFDQIFELGKTCKFKDCTHTSETGCKVLEALEKGKLDEFAYQNFLKMEREKAHYEASVFEKRKKEKQFGKMMKNYKKDIKKNKLP